MSDQQEKPKSVLDDIPVKDKGFPMSDSQEGEGPEWIHDAIRAQDKAFPLSPLRQQMEKLSKPARTIVGACPHCGSPIYGHVKLLDGDDPDTLRSCKCLPQGQQLLTAKEEGMSREEK